MGADYSVTDLIKPTKVTLLTKRHRHELPPEKDDTVKIQSIIGTGTHNHLDYLTRRYAMSHPDIRLHTEVRLWDRILGKRISGQFDGWLDGLLYDYKITKSWKVRIGDHADWEHQLNLYDYLARTTVGLETDAAGIIAIIKDWQSGKATGYAAEKDYPKLNYVGVPIPLWGLEKQEAYIMERIGLLIASEILPDEELPDCTSDEMWEKLPTLAIMPDKSKRAARLCPDMEAVESYLAWRAKRGNPIEKYTIQERPGTRKRCAEFCNVNSWCRQWKEYCGNKKV